MPIAYNCWNASSIWNFHLEVTNEYWRKEFAHKSPKNITWKNGVKTVKSRWTVDEKSSNFCAKKNCWKIQMDLQSVWDVNPFKLVSLKLIWIYILLLLHRWQFQTSNSTNIFGNSGNLPQQKWLNTEHLPYPYPDAPCMDCNNLPTLGQNWPQSRGNVGKDSLHGASGIWTMTMYIHLSHKFTSFMWVHIPHLRRGIWLNL